MISPTFWNGKRVLVTGHTGFKGSWLCLWLQSMGADVIGYALRPPTDPNLFEVALVVEGMTSLMGDVRELDHLTKVVQDYRPEAIFHMAAQSLVRASYADPVTTYTTNVMGTVNVLEAARRAGGVRIVLVVTSDKCYENREWVWGHRESEPMGGYDPYSNSKGCAELVASAYRHSYFNPAAFSQHRTAVATARAGNVIGGGDWAKDRLIPDIVRAITSGKPAVIRNPYAIRPWQHVMEPLSGYLMLAQRLVEEGPSYAEAWNFGPEERDARSVAWIADRLVALWGEGANWVQDGGSHPHEAHYLKLDCAKVHARLGWWPALGLDQALRFTVDWYKVHAQGGDLRAITHRQIDDYTKLINGSSA